MFSECPSRDLFFEKPDSKFDDSFDDVDSLFSFENKALYL